MRLIKQNQIGYQIQTGAMATQARIQRQRLGNCILEHGGKAKIKATLVIVLTSLIIKGVLIE